MAGLTKLDLFILQEFNITDIDKVPNFVLDHSGSNDYASSRPYVNWFAVAMVVKIVAFSAYHIYRRYFSEAANACNNKSGHERSNCINKYKEKAKKAYNEVIRKGMPKCDKSKDPKKCKQLLKDKMKS